VDLQNATPLAAELNIGAPLPSGRRRGMIVTKATFRYDASGNAQLDAESPYPMFRKDEETPLGLLPRDDLPRLDTVFEVALLGSARATQGRVEHLRVAMTVGTRRREIDVFGERRFVGDGPSAAISRPQPFTAMPLSWSRAFGGKRDVEVDEDSPVAVSFADNPLGIGFDPALEAKKLDDFLGCPPGYPRFDPSRTLPNLERPEQRIDAWADAPEPVSWAPLPLDLGLHSKRSYRLIEEPGSPLRAELVEARFHRAHPDWVLAEPPAAGTPIVLENIAGEGRLQLQLPALEVHFDYVLGARSGSKQLRPQMLVLLPDERRFYLVHRLPFEVEEPDGSERSARIRIANEGRT